MGAYVFLAMRLEPYFYRHPVTDEDCLLVLFAAGRHEMPARLAALASTWALLGLSCEADHLFTYEFNGRLWAATVEAESTGDAETQLTALAHSVWSRGIV